LVDILKRRSGIWWRHINSQIYPFPERESNLGPQRLSLLLFHGSKWTVSKDSPTTDLDRSWGFREVEAPRLQNGRHVKVVRFFSPAHWPSLPLRIYSC